MSHAVVQWFVKFHHHSRVTDFNNVMNIELQPSSSLVLAPAVYGVFLNLWHFAAHVSHVCCFLKSHMLLYLQCVLLRPASDPPHLLFQSPDPHSHPLPCSPFTHWHSSGHTSPVSFIHSLSGFLTCLSCPQHFPSFITSVSGLFVVFVYRVKWKTVKQISMKLGGRTGCGPRENPLSFGMDLDTGADPGWIFIPFFKYISNEIRPFFGISIF